MRMILLLVVIGAVASCADQPEPLLGPDGPDAIRAAAAAGNGPPEFVPGRLLVRFQPGAPADQIARAHGAELTEPLALGIQSLRLQPGRELDVARALAHNPNVVWAEPDFIYPLEVPCKAEGGICVGPNDPFFGYKWDLHNNGFITASTGEVLASTGAVDADMDWLEAFDHLGGSFDGAAVIGIIDSGVRASHVELAGRVLAMADFYGSTSGADDNGHGTHVAGIAMARGNDGAGLPGVAWGPNVKIVSAKVCGLNFPFGYTCNSTAIVNGITWAVDQGANVLNLSLGGGSGSSAQQNALAYARDNNVLPFCAAGNNNSSVSYPAAFPECVAVSATNWSDGKASYSNFGSQIELAAPGGDTEDDNGYSYIASSYHSDDTAYALMAGTSMASPQAAGLAALLHALGMTDAEAKLARMKETADDLGSSNVFGAGRINLWQAIADVDPGDPGDPGDPPNQPPVASFTADCEALTCTFTDTSTDPDGSVVAWSWSFGDGATSSAQHPQHTYGADGAYTVTLVVTDDDGATGETSQNIEVAAADDPPPADPDAIELSANGYKVRGIKHVDLVWSGAQGNQVHLFRDGSHVQTLANSGAYTDSWGGRGGGSHTFQVCETDSDRCSAVVTVSF
jgi:PKD repeat protein